MSVNEFLKDCRNDKNDKRRAPPQADRDVSTFTVSDEVIQKLASGEENKPQENGKEEKVTYRKKEKKTDLAKQDENWRSIEKQMDHAHDKKVGMDPDSISALERSIHHMTQTKCPCAGGMPVLDCYDENTEKPLNCRIIVMEYIRCVDKYTRNCLKKNDIEM